MVRPHAVVECDQRGDRARTQRGCEQLGRPRADLASPASFGAMDGVAAGAAEGAELAEGEAPAEREASASTSPRVDATSPVMAALSQLSPSLDDKIATMKAAQKKLKLDRKRVAKELRNAEKRRRRLRARCKELPAEDLLEVLAMRQVKDAEAAASTPE